MHTIVTGNAGCNKVTASPHGNTMVSVYQFTCADDGHSFQVHTEDQDEVVDVVQRHAKTKHNMEMTEGDIRDGLETVEV